MKFWTWPYISRVFVCVDLNIFSWIQFDENCLIHSYSKWCAVDKTISAAHILHPNSPAFRVNGLISIWNSLIDRNHLWFIRFTRIETASHVLSDKNDDFLWHSTLCGCWKRLVRWTWSTITITTTTTNYIIRIEWQMKISIWLYGCWSILLYLRSFPQRKIE